MIVSFGCGTRCEVCGYRLANQIDAFTVKGWRFPDDQHPTLFVDLSCPECNEDRRIGQAVAMVVA